MRLELRTSEVATRSLNITQVANLLNDSSKTKATQTRQPPVTTPTTSWHGRTSMLLLTTIYSSQPHRKCPSFWSTRMRALKLQAQKLLSRSSALPSRSKTLPIWSKTLRKETRLHPLKMSARLTRRKSAHQRPQMRQDPRRTAQSPLYRTHRVRQPAVTPVWLCLLHLLQTSTRKRPSQRQPFTTRQKLQMRTDTPSIRIIIITRCCHSRPATVSRRSTTSMEVSRVPHLSPQLEQVSSMSTKWKSWQIWDNRRQMWRGLQGQLSVKAKKLNPLLTSWTSKVRSRKRPKTNSR